MPLRRSEYLGVQLRTAVQVHRRRPSSRVKLGRVIRVRREDVDQYLERCRIKPGELRHLYPATSEEDEWEPGPELSR